MLAQSQFSTTNYMVPSNGQTHCVAYKGTASSTPFLIDWRQFAIDAQSFQPQGVFIDNTQGTVPLVLVVNPIGYVITVPAGTTQQSQFPAPSGQTMTITGDPINQVSIYFVDFPVLPSGLSAQITNVPNVIIQGIVETDTTPLAAGNSLPYRTQDYVALADYKYGAITGAAVTVALAPTSANENLRKLSISLSGNAATAAGGALTVSVLVGAVQVCRKTIYLPAAAPAAPGVLSSIIDVDFPVGIPMAGSALNVTISTALSVGTLDANAYFAAQ